MVSSNLSVLFGHWSLSPYRQSYQEIRFHCESRYLPQTHSQLLLISATYFTDRLSWTVHFVLHHLIFFRVYVWFAAIFVFTTEMDFLTICLSSFIDTTLRNFKLLCIPSFYLTYPRVCRKLYLFHSFPSRAREPSAYLFFTFKRLKLLQVITGTNWLSIFWNSFSCLQKIIKALFY